MSKTPIAGITNGQAVEVPIAWVLPHPTDAQKVVLTLPWEPIERSVVVAVIERVAREQPEWVPLGGRDPALEAAAEQAGKAAQNSRKQLPHIGMPPAERLSTEAGEPAAAPDKAATAEIAKAVVRALRPYLGGASV